MLIDAAALGMSVWAARLALRPAAGRMTFGFRRAEILAAQANGITLLLLGALIVVEAVRRLHAPPDVDGADRRRDGRRRCASSTCWRSAQVARANRANLNVEGSYRHLLTDLFAFAGTAVAGAVIWATGFEQADAIASLAVAGSMLWAGWPLVRRSGQVLLEAAPEGIAPDEITARSCALTAASPTSTTCTSGRSARAASRSLGARARRPGRGLPRHPPRARGRPARAVRDRPHDAPGRAHGGPPARHQPPGPLSSGPRAAPTTARAQAISLRRQRGLADLRTAGPFFWLAKRSTRRHGVTKYKLEYIWLDGYEPDSEPAQQDEDRVVHGRADARGRCRSGTSTAARRGRRKARARTASCSRSPLFPDPARANAMLVMCEVLLPGRDAASVEQPRDDPGRPRTRGSASSRSTSSTATARRSASRRDGFPAPQGEYYTGVGFKNVGDVAREIVEAHIDLCLAAGINLEGINAEVAKGQWEFQIFGKGSKRAADEMWIARYLLLRLCERYGIDINFHPKPLGIEHDWNGSGMHTQLLDRAHARGRRRGVLRGADGGVRRAQGRRTSRSTAPTTTCV